MSALTTGKSNEHSENPVIFGLYQEQLWESAKVMQGQNKRKDTTDNTFMKCASNLPSNDIGTLTSTERFVFLHAVVIINSAMAFLRTERGVKRTKDDFFQLLFHAISSLHKYG